MHETTRDGPLAGIVVVDLTRVVAGPVAGRTLADLGADVIKIEPPDGDVSRHIAPKSDRGMSGLFTLGNLGKRCICVDLRADGASELVLSLIERADVVLENFRVGVMERLGLGWETIHERNPRAVMLSINGYGSKSKWSHRPAYAPMMHAFAGVLQWEAQTTETPVVEMADNKADMSAGLHGAIAVLAALLRRQTTGQGEHLEVPLFDALMATYSESAYALLPEPVSRDECHLFDSRKHGKFAIAGTPQNAWAVAKAGLGLTDGAGPDADVPTKARLRHRSIEDWMHTQPDEQTVIDELEKLNLAAAPVRALADTLHHEIAQERQLLHEADDRRGGTRPVVRAPYWFSGKTLEPARPAPRRGEHNDEVLREVLGLDASQIERLQQDGVLLRSEDER